MVCYTMRDQRALTTGWHDIYIYIISQNKEQCRRNQTKAKLFYLVTQKLIYTYIQFFTHLFLIHTRELRSELSRCWYLTSCLLFVVADNQITARSQLTPAGYNSSTHNVCPLKTNRCCGHCYLSQQQHKKKCNLNCGKKQKDKNGGRQAEKMFLWVKVNRVSYEYLNVWQTVRQMFALTSTRVALIFHLF